MPIEEATEDKMKNEEFVMVSIRIPKELHIQIKDRAAKEDRSVNREVIYLLRQALNIK